MNLSFPDWSPVTERIWVGGSIDTPNQMRGIFETGITHIINLQSGQDDKPLLIANTEYLHLPIPDNRQPWESAWIWNAFDWVLKALAANPKHKVYIHCRAGISRSPSMVYGVLRAFGLDSELAHVVVKRARPQAELNYKSSIELALRKIK